MILTASAIKEAHEAGRIVIEPYEESRVGPNSVDVRLASELQVYDCFPLDAALPNSTTGLLIPDEGMILQPGRLYLARTLERIGSDHYVTHLDGRSSVGRLGIKVHMTAGRGDLGWKGSWCLELEVVHPVRVYAGMKIAQATFYAVQGEITQLYQGKYKGGLEPSRLHLDSKEGS
jgi:dCTP deaminase